MRSAAIAIGIAISIICGCGGASADRDARFEPLAAPVGLETTWAAALSSDGRVVVGSGSPWQFQGYDWRVALRWVRTRAESLDVPGEAFLVSSDGSVVAGSRALVLTRYRGMVLPIVSEPFTWSRAKGVQGFFRRAPEPRLLTPTVISPDAGVFLGVVYDLGGEGEAYRWTADSEQLLPTVPIGHNPTPIAMTPDGSVIAGTVVVFIPNDDGGGSQGQSRAVRWTGGDVVLYHPVEGLEDCTPQALSRDGRVTVGGCWEHTASFSNGRAVRWEGDHGEALPPLPRETYSSAIDVSADGSLIVGDLNLEGELGIFVWTAATGKRNLIDVLVEGGAGDDVAGWTLTAVAGLSDDGRVIAGTAKDSTGRVRAFRAVIPESRG